MNATINVRAALTVLKTIEAATATALDADYLDFVRTLTSEEQLVSVQFTIISGVYVAFIVYTQ